MTRGRCWAILAVFTGSVYAQNAELSGLILDSSNSSISNAEISLRNEQTGGRRSTKSSTAGFYSFASLKPGEYRLYVRATGFETTIQDGIQLEVGATVRIDFSLRIGDARTEVTVHGGAPLINTENASVGTVIDRSLIDEMPLNGRGIQSLIELSPGAVVLSVANPLSGQFAINGQRNNANYFTVDGASANFALSKVLATTGALERSQIGTGMIPANNFYGTFSNLVAPESLQEFKIQTSTFAPEYGRSPGGQIGMVTRSGTNRYSGSLFEYFRNDKTDANGWFANRQGLAKPPLRLNNFGGVLGGPVQLPRLYNGRDRTFFFVSVDELLTSQPQPTVSQLVPTLEVRKAAPALVAQFLNTYPLPNRPATSQSPPGFAEYAATYSLRQSQHSFSIRGDHTFNERWTSFARYNRAPSRRSSGFDTLPSVIGEFTLATETLTFGLTQTPAANMVNDLRLNASRQSASSDVVADPVAGIQVPDESVLFPAGYSSKDSTVTFGISPGPFVRFGHVGDTQARQLQAVDHFFVSHGPHQIKFGVDYRWHSPVDTISRSEYFFMSPGLYGPSGAMSGTIPQSQLSINRLPTTAFVYKAFSAYVQDTWKAGRRLTLTYGLRWDLAPSPKVSAGQAAIARGGPQEPTAYVPTGESIYQTTWTNFAPRLGFAWQALDRGERKVVVRLGAGSFFDVGHSGTQGRGYYATSTTTYLERPLESPTGGFAGPPSVPSPLSSMQTRVVSSTYQPPYAWQWNATVEQSIGQQSFSAAYIGALGRRLSAWGAYPLTSGIQAVYLNNDSSSSYHAMQLQFNRRVNTRVRMLVSYSWSHSIDDLSSDHTYTFPNGGPTSLYYEPRRKGSSDFDVRHSLNGSVIARLPSPPGRLAKILLRDWTANSIFFARTALPTDILADNYVHRPDVVPGQPLYLYGSQFPGGKSFNLSAFTLPPPGRDGNFGRNVLRGLGAWQIDFALHREFRFTERTKVQFRAEAFNLFNHPNFANASNFQSPSMLSLNPRPEFGGAATKTLANGLSPVAVLGGLNPLFQIGGPRSMQFAVRLGF